MVVLGTFSLWLLGLKLTLCTLVEVICQDSVKILRGLTIRQEYLNHQFFEGVIVMFVMRLLR